jgi:hypothetical protein
LTPDEKRQALDGKLDRSLSEFDAALARKQADIESRRGLLPDPAAQGAGQPGAATASPPGTPGGAGIAASPSARGSEAASAGGSGEQEATARQAGASRREGRKDSGTAKEGSLPQEEKSGSRRGEEADARYSGADPPNLPDPADDDVVARQLREAAEKEQDPAIRARLWEEYLEYRRSAGSVRR